VLPAVNLCQPTQTHAPASLTRAAFHEEEISQYERLSGPTQRAQFVASRWAVKEAAYKAFGTSRILFPEIVLDKTP
jgi:phosphopantetheine--protein transferase-like protein